jgi:hypothetical protein
MIILSFLIFLAPVISGVLLVHWLWSERTGMAMLLKLCLGIGLGLGANSFVYFLSLLLGLDFRILEILQISILVFLAILTVVKAGRDNRA